EYVCKYAPVEIVKGFGEDCILCNPLPDNFAAADQLTHRNICSYSRALIEKRMKNSSGALLLTNCCDSLKSACDVLRSINQTVFLLNLPHLNKHCSKILYKNELLNFIKNYTAYSGKSFDCAKFRRAFAQNAQEIKGPYVAVMGARLSGELLEFIKKASPLPVKNNTCTDVRTLQNPPLTDSSEKLLEWYADELLSQTPCMRMSDASSRRMLVNDPNLKGIIYNTVNFCDFYGFEYMQLRKQLTIPIVKIETDYTTQGAAQIKTRTEAFFENLKISLTAPPEKKQLYAVHPRGLERYTAGIDSGSTTTNVVILDSMQNIVSFSVLPTGVDVAESAEKALDDALQKAGLSKNQITRTVTTGYGRTNIAFRKKDVTEITCHAVGAHFLNPAVRTVIDIGGQDSKIIRLDENGTVLRFVMNDKCAAGTGRFLEMMAQSLGLTLEEMSICGLQWDEEITISSMCSVFAQSEVVSLIAEGKKLEDIVHGLNLSVASKVIALGGRAKMEREYMITGGVAKNIGVVRAIEEKLGIPVLVPEEPEICGALGAALIAAK
ncbi:MAG: acyl-CoA dehydratase activase, partial [Syntrophaceticus sp.]